MQVTRLFWLTYRNQLASMQWALAKLNSEIGRHIAVRPQDFTCLCALTYLCRKSRAWNSDEIGRAAGDSMIHVVYQQREDRCQRRLKTGVNGKTTSVSGDGVDALNTRPIRI